MNRTIERVVWAGVFFALLASAVISSVAGLRPLEIQSGAAVDTPALLGREAFHAEYYRGVDAYLAEQLSTKGIGVRSRAFVDYRLLGDSTTSAVIVGSDHVAYLARYAFVACQTISDFTPLSNRVATPESSDIRYMVISPKTAVQQASLPDYARPSDCVVQARQAREDMIELDPMGIELGPHLAAMATNSQFFPTDTHWSPQGRVVVARSIVETYQRGLWDEDAVVPGEVERLQGLGRIIGIKESDNVEGVVVDRGPVIEVSRKENVERNQVSSITTRSEAAGVIPGTTLVIGDSQMAFLVPYLASYFEELIFINWSSFVRNPDTVIPDADRVLIETIEVEAVGRFNSPTMSELLKRFS